ncbi:unnamed protein product, partial [Ectocarpus sp. 4 AP-2014]
AVDKQREGQKDTTQQRKRRGERSLNSSFRVRAMLGVMRALGPVRAAVTPSQRWYHLCLVLILYPLQQITQRIRTVHAMFLSAVVAAYGGVAQQLPMAQLTRHPVTVADFAANIPYQLTFQHVKRTTIQQCSMPSKRATCHD